MVLEVCELRGVALFASLFQARHVASPVRASFHHHEPPLLHHSGAAVVVCKAAAAKRAASRPPSSVVCRVSQARKWRHQC